MSGTIGWLILVSASAKRAKFCSARRNSGPHRRPTEASSPGVGRADRQHLVGLALAFQADFSPLAAAV